MRMEIQNEWNEKWKVKLKSITILMMNKLNKLIITIHFEIYHKQNKLKPIIWNMQCEKKSCHRLK